MSYDDDELKEKPLKLKRDIGPIHYPGPGWEMMSDLQCDGIGIYPNLIALNLRSKRAALICPQSRDGDSFGVGSNGLKWAHDRMLQKEFKKFYCVIINRDGDVVNYTHADDLYWYFLSKPIRAGRSIAFGASRSFGGGTHSGYGGFRYVNENFQIVGH